MATNDSTALTTGDATVDFFKEASCFCRNMDILLELADREIKEHKSAEMLATELLIRVARAEITLFGGEGF